jgi:CSLREA domain-containing protein
LIIEKKQLKEDEKMRNDKFKLHDYSSWIYGVIVPIIFFAISILLAWPVSSVALTVNSTNDPGNGVCDLAECTLREAVNSTPAGGTVDFNISLPNTITLDVLSGDIDINKPLIIIGPGADQLTISGNSSSRIFNVDDGLVTQIEVEISGLTLTEGQALDGGAINNFENLKIDNCTFSGNNADSSGGGISNSDPLSNLTVTNGTFTGNTAGQGGGVVNELGTLIVTNSTFSGNSAGTSGGGVRNLDTLTVTNSTFSGNSAGTSGGGIGNSRGTLTVTNSTFTGNTADSSGGGISNSSSVGDLTVTNSTFSGNIAVTVGGGIVNDSTLTVTNSTFTGNSASGGGGILNDDFAGASTNLLNTIMANSLSGGNCAGTFFDDDFNIDDGMTCGFSEAGSQSNTNPQLDPAGLQDNGGPTQTIALQPLSPAIDAIPDGTNGCNMTITTDQRGFVRPVDGPDSDSDEECDIGAFEFGSFSDADSDGIPDDADNCPNSDLSPTVVIDGCDSGVENSLSVLDQVGCTISDLIAEIAESSSNHGQFVSGVSHLTNELKKDGIIIESEKGVIQHCADQANIP